MNFLVKKNSFQSPVHIVINTVNPRCIKQKCYITVLSTVLEIIYFGTTSIRCYNSWSYDLQTALSRTGHIYVNKIRYFHFTCIWMKMNNCFAFSMSEWCFWSVKSHITYWCMISYLCSVSSSWLHFMTKWKLFQNSLNRICDTCFFNQNLMENLIQSVKMKKKAC